MKIRMDDDVLALVFRNPEIHYTEDQNADRALLITSFK